ncbi:MAG: hypothetical protein F9K44_16435 [Hyphomicrobiaceae bacterium]|nr:MAG: hypothetical protein F9K44_16435 [Hyphomicrobiaceae bacterium]
MDLANRLAVERTIILGDDELARNVFVVKDGQMSTPRGRYVLEGVSRATVIELAKELRVPVVERDIDLYDAYTADEVFLTSTSLCLCGVSCVNGKAIGGGKIPGPVTKRLLKAYSDLVGCDIEKQYLARLG